MIPCGCCSQICLPFNSSGYIWRWAETKTPPRWFSPPSLNFSRGCAVNSKPSPRIVRGASQFECGFSRSCDDSENEPIRLVFLRSGDNHRWQQIMTATTALGVVLLRASSVVELPLLCFEVEKQFHNEMKSQRYLYARLLVSCKG